MVKRKKMSPREFEFVISSYYDDSKKIYITYYVIRIEVIYWFLHKLAVLPNTERKRERFAEANRAKQVSIKWEKQEATLLARKGLPLGRDHPHVLSQVQVTRNRYDRYDDNGYRRRP